MGLAALVGSLVAAYQAWCARQDARSAKNQSVVNGMKADTAIVQATKAADQSRVASETSAKINKQVENDLPHLIKAVQELQVKTSYLPGIQTDPAGKGIIA